MSHIQPRDVRTAAIDGIGEPGMRALHEARVLVVGAGGLGSPALAYLAAAGVGTLGVSDGDVIEPSNLQRQVLHGPSRLGMIKSASAAQTLAYLNPDVTVVPEPHVTAETGPGMFSRYDLVIDATDSFASKYLIDDVGAAAGATRVWGTIVGLTYQVSVFDAGIRLRDLYPVEPAAGTTPASTEVGVLGAAVGQAGSCLATEAIKLITGVGEPLRGRVLIADTRAGRWDVVPFVAKEPA